MTFTSISHFFTQAIFSRVFKFHLLILQILSFDLFCDVKNFNYSVYSVLVISPRGSESSWCIHLILISTSVIGGECFVFILAPIRASNLAGTPILTVLCADEVLTFTTKKMFLIHFQHDGYCRLPKYLFQTVI